MCNRQSTLCLSSVSAKGPSLYHPPESHNSASADLFQQQWGAKADRINQKKLEKKSHPFTLLMHGQK